ncbi:MAG: ABC transporter substrate-binding protein, partial [Gammaproteobacteria bacterium]|nr:ABC transporter substrate-binding protein [Gammaproteobacteria bacterium]
MLRGLALGVGAAGAAALAGCGEAQVITETKIKEVIKEVPVEKVVTQIVEKEVVVEKEVEVEVEKVVTQIVEKEKIVEKVVTAAPAAPKAVTIDVTLPANTPEAAEFFEEVVNKPFMAENPHITVNGIFPPYGEWRRGVLTRMAANEEPDVFGVGGFELPVYAVRGVLYTLDEFYKRDSDQLADMAFPKGGIFDLDGKRYGLTRTVFVTSMTYNPSMFEEKGIAPSEINN